MSKLNLPNKLSIFRILVIPFFVACIMYYTPEREFLRIFATIIFILAVISDGLDGYIARVRNERTKIGTFLDPLADKLLLITVYICLGLAQNLPPQLRLAPWIVIIVISRDVIIVFGALIIYMANGKITVTPTALGKITTFLQMMTILALLLQIRALPLVMYSMAIFTVLSGLDYIRLGSKLFNDIK